MSLELGSLQSYCPLETHLYQERLRWKSQQPCYPYHHFWHYPYTFFPFHYSDQVLACFQFRLCVAGSQSVTEVAPPKKWVTSHSQHCTRLKKEIKVAPAASKKEKFVAQWRLCKLRKKKTTTVKTENHFMPLKGKRYGGEKEFCLKTFQQIILFILNGFSYHYLTEVVLLPQKKFDDVTLHNCSPHMSAYLFWRQVVWICSIVPRQNRKIIQIYFYVKQLACTIGKYWHWFRSTMYL